MSSANQTANSKKTFGIVAVRRDPITDLEVTSKRYVDNKIVIGDIKYSVRNIDHMGWLVCDGRSLSRTEYNELFSVIGTTYGAIDSSTFKIPDCRGRVLGGIGTGAGLTARSAGTLIGSESTTLTTTELPSHTHSGTTTTDGSHTHTSNANGGQGGLGLVTANGSNTETGVDSSLGELNLWTTPYALTIDSNGNHNHSFTTGSTGNGQPFSNIQPTAFIGNIFVFALYT